MAQIGPLLASQLLTSSPVLLALLLGFAFTLSAYLKGRRRRSAALAACAFAVLLVVHIVGRLAPMWLMFAHRDSGAMVMRQWSLILAALSLILSLIDAGAYAMLAVAVLLPDRGPTPPPPADF
jgi:hypothetical protein